MSGILFVCPDGDGCNGSLDEWGCCTGLESEALTTGGCEESVNWVVFKNPLAIKVTSILSVNSWMALRLQELLHRQASLQMKVGTIVCQHHFIILHPLRNRKK